MRVEIDVRNDGGATALTQGPLPGFTYAEGESAAGRGYPDIPGRWRVGVDFAARSGGIDHPYRWGLGGDLAPGASTTIVGYITLTTPRTTTYWAGLVQEQVAWTQDHVFPHSVTVSAEPPVYNLSVSGGAIRVLAQVYQCTPEGTRVRVWKAYNTSSATYLYTTARPADHPCGELTAVAALDAIYNERQLTIYNGSATPGSWFTQCVGAGHVRKVWRTNADGRNAPFQYPEIAMSCP